MTKGWNRLNGVSIFLNTILFSTSAQINSTSEEKKYIQKNVVNNNFAIQLVSSVYLEKAHSFPALEVMNHRKTFFSKLAKRKIQLLLFFFLIRTSDC